ncbi:hypothetical protein C0J52_20105 [Blattella germanica]|nr:hypothetical protein C0J52_20105 [Blattella germanica]
MDSSMESSGNSPLEKVDACIVHCIFREMHMLDDSGIPDRALVTKMMIQKLRDSKVVDFVEESIDDCFELLENDDKRNSCDYTKNLALCLEEKGRRNCEDWEDGSDTSTNRNSKNSKRQN